MIRCPRCQSVRVVIRVRHYEGGSWLARECCDCGSPVAIAAAAAEPEGGASAGASGGSC